MGGPWAVGDPVALRGQRPGGAPGSYGPAPGVQMGPEVENRIRKFRVHEIPEGNNPVTSCFL